MWSISIYLSTYTHTHIYINMYVYLRLYLHVCMCYVLNLALTLDSKLQSSGGKLHINGHRLYICIILTHTDRFIECSFPGQVTRGNSPTTLRISCGENKTQPQIKEKQKKTSRNPYTTSRSGIKRSDTTTEDMWVVMRARDHVAG